MAIIKPTQTRGVVIQIRDPEEEKSHSITVHGMQGVEIKNHIQFLIERLVESDEEEVYIRHYKPRKGGMHE